MEKDYYSLWLMPPKEQFEQLQNLVNRLARKYKTPTFEPHVTLLGGFKAETDSGLVKEKVSELSQNLGPLPVSLNEFGFGENFYQRFYLKCQPAEGLIRSNLEAQKLFSENRQYTPHLSLLYGDSLTDKQKQQLLIETKLKLPLSFESTEMLLYRTPEDNPLKRELLSKFELRPPRPIERKG